MTFRSVNYTDPSENIATCRIEAARGIVSLHKIAFPTLVTAEVSQAPKIGGSLRDRNLGGITCSRQATTVTLTNVM